MINLISKHKCCKKVQPESPLPFTKLFLPRILTKGSPISIQIVFLLLTKSSFPEAFNPINNAFTTQPMEFSTYSFSTKKVLLRVDFNVPIDKVTFEILDDKRIKAALPTINHIINHNGIPILLSHFGRPKNGPENQFSLIHIVKRLEELIQKPIIFCKNLEEAERRCKDVCPGEVILLENVRFYPEETQGDLAFAERLASLGDCYVNDAFGSAHRAHASTTQIARHFPTDKMIGFLMAEELACANKILQNPQKPFTAIVGGAKVSDKVLIIENLLNIASDIIIGGGMAYTFVYAQGGSVGSSLLEKDKVDVALSILHKAKEKGVNIHLPQDSIAASSFLEHAETTIVPTHSIPYNWMGLDIGPESIARFCDVVSKSKTILWNGPMGVFEWERFELGTKSLAVALAEATEKGSFTLVGGGDSASAIAKFKLSHRVSHVSTGGGALLELFEGKELPGIKALT